MGHVLRRGCLWVDGWVAGHKPTLRERNSPGCTQGCLEGAKGGSVCQRFSCSAESYQRQKPAQRSARNTGYTNLTCTVCETFSSLFPSVKSVHHYSSPNVVHFIGSEQEIELQHRHNGI